MLNRKRNSEENKVWEASSAEEKKSVLFWGEYGEMCAVYGVSVSGVVCMS